jgi:hypothetical protein
LKRQGFYKRSEEHSLASRGVKTKTIACGYADNIIHIGGIGQQFANQIIQSDYQIKLLRNTITTPQQLGFPNEYSKNQAIEILNINKQNDIIKLRKLLKRQAIDVGQYNSEANQNYTIKRPDGTIMNI